MIDPSPDPSATTSAGAHSAARRAQALPVADVDVACADVMSRLRALAGADLPPRTFNPGRVLRAVDGRPERRYRLTRLLQRGADFERVAFEPQP